MDKGNEKEKGQERSEEQQNKSRPEGDIDVIITTIFCTQENRRSDRVEKRQDARKGDRPREKMRV